MLAGEVNVFCSSVYLSPNSTEAYVIWRSLYLMEWWYVELWVLINRLRIAMKSSVIYGCSCVGYKVTTLIQFEMLDKSSD